MKKYIYLKEGDIIQEGDELKGSHGWLLIDAVDYAGTSVRYSEEKMESFRRPVPHTGDVQFLMCVSILVPVIVNCDGKAQDEIEVDAGCLTVQKILSEPTQYVHLENIDWAACKVDEVQPEPKNPGKYRMLEVGEEIENGDQFLAGDWWDCEEEDSVSIDYAVGDKVTADMVGDVRRPITERQHPIGCEKENGYGESKDGGKTGLWMVFDKGQQSGTDINSIHPKHYFTPRVERIDEPTDQEPLESDNIAWELAKLAGYDLDVNGYVCEFPITKPQKKNAYDSDGNPIFKKSVVPQYRPFVEGDVIEEGDQFRFSEKSEWANLSGPFPKEIDQSIISSKDFRKLTK